MNKKLKSPPKPSKPETERLKNFLKMEDWHFETLIRSNCTEIEMAYLGWTKAYGKSESVKAFLYGLKAIKTDTQQSCLANFFIRYGSRVYQTYSIKDACEILDFLEKEFKFSEYKHKLWQKKFRERQKLIAQKSVLQIKNVKTKVKEVA